MPYPKPNKTERSKGYFAGKKDQGEILPFGRDQMANIQKAKKFLIVCEGINTERAYFESFPVVQMDIVTVIGGFPGGKQYLVREALKLSAKVEYKNHEVWCIFDFDVKYDNLKQKDDFNAAIQLGLANSFKMAFSNDAFELWFVLHYKLIHSQHHRKEYFDMLTEKWDLEHSYESMGKEEEFCKTIYKKLLPHQNMAMKHAEKLFNEKNDGRPYHEMNPCTKVFELVKELNKYIRR